MMSLTTKQKVLILIIEDILPQLESLSLKTENKKFVYYVENELFPQGVYRIYAPDLLPRSMYLGDEDYKMVCEHFDNVHFDSSSLWLTISVKSDNQLS